VRREGIVSKRLGSRYRSGRSPDWLKFKNPAAPAVRREAEGVRRKSPHRSGAKNRGRLIAEDEESGIGVTPHALLLTPYTQRRWRTHETGFEQIWLCCCRLLDRRSLYLKGEADYLGKKSLVQL
jgi:hypothetical protein